MTIPTSNDPSYDRLPTNISLARWCALSGTAWEDKNLVEVESTFRPARIPALMPAGHENDDVYWLDRLLGGGIVLPKRDLSGQKAVTLLLTGPPGAGKSTLAMEMAYRWGQTNHVLYLTSEASAGWLIKKAQWYGWDDAGTRFHDADAAKPTENGKFGVRVVSIQGEGATTADPSPGILSPAESTGSDLDDQVGQLEQVRRRIQAWAGALLPLTQRASRITKPAAVAPSGIAIVDSLNSSEPDRTSRLFKGYLQLLSSGPSLVIIVLDTPGAAGASPFWEYVCDIVIRVDRSYVNDQYMTRWLEIVKARYQQHAWGRHLMKIYDPPRLLKEAGKPPKFERREGETGEAYHARLLRAFPYSTEGGLFVFPSIHYVLSCYKRIAPHAAAGAVDTSLPELDELLGGGLPKGRCTAFLGCRGGHKSHLGYVHLLHRIGKGEKALVVSLRDDEGFTRKAMRGILGDRSDLLNTWMQQGQLEIMYFPPGYITPEEFFHRLMMGVYRMKSGSGNVSVLFNSLDQLGARFPLCARETIFVPSMIHLLSAEEVTSIFVAAREADQPTEYYGLEATAELILTFERISMKADDYCSAVRSARSGPKTDPQLPPSVQTVVFEISRFAGGQAAGASAILELVDERSKGLGVLYGKPGLHCVPLHSRPAKSPQQHPRGNDARDR